jgi:ABC-2 type transport system permease protein
MKTLVGTGPLTKLALRRDRTMLVIWLYAFAAFAGATVVGFRKLYPTVDSRVDFVVTANHNPALLSIYGPMYGSSLGSFTAWRDTALTALLAGLMSIFIVVRHTRADEESGRLELAGSAVVGRHAALMAAMLVACIANIVVGGLMATVVIALGLPAAGSIAIGAGVATCGLVFTAVAAVAAQLAQAARSARGLAIGVLLVAFLFRAIGDSAGPTGPRWLSWLSPIGWAELTRAFGGAIRWWVLVLPIVTAVLAGAVAAVLAVERDYDAGLLATRRGRGDAAAWLRTPFGLAWRLQRSTVMAWIGGALVYGVVLGSATSGISGLLSSPQVKKIVIRMGGHAGVTDAYLAALMSFTGLAVAGFAIAAVLRLRTEETEERGDPVLATTVGRIGWALSHVVIAVTGTVAILAVIGLGVGLGYGARSGSLGHEIARLVGAGLAQAPAAVVIAGLAVALFGIAPRASVTVSWSVLGAAVMLLVLGATLRLPQWVLDASPFTHLPKLPGGAASATPLAWLCLIAAALLAAGMVGVRRRDIG